MGMRQVSGQLFHFCFFFSPFFSKTSSLLPDHFDLRGLTLRDFWAIVARPAVRDFPSESDPECGAVHRGPGAGRSHPVVRGHAFGPGNIREHQNEEEEEKHFI